MQLGSSGFKVTTWRAFIPSYQTPLHAMKELTKGQKHKTIKPQIQLKKIRHLLIGSPVGIVVEGQLNLLSLPV